MYTLTERMVQAQSKESDFRYVKQLKCWGQNLRDVSIVTRLCNVEILMLSINEITTLEPFAHCKKLKALYLKENMITDINELKYLKSLPDLKILWLEGNPCCKIVGDNYRQIVLSTLPHLKKLDNVDVSMHEVEEALRCGLELDKYQEQQQSKQAQHLSTQDMPQQCKSRSNSNVQEVTTRCPGGEERPIRPAKNGNASCQLDYNYSKLNHDSQATLSQWSQQNEPRECTSNLSEREERTVCSASKDRSARSRQNVNTSYQDNYPVCFKPNHDSQATLSQWSQKDEPQDYKCRSKQRVREGTYSDHRVTEVATRCSDTSQCNDMPERCPFGDDDASKSDISQKMDKRSSGDDSQSNVLTAMITFLSVLDSDSLVVLDQEICHRIRMKNKQG